MPFTFPQLLPLSPTATSPLPPSTPLSGIPPFFNTPPKSSIPPASLEPPGSAQCVSDTTQLHTTQTDHHGKRAQRPFHPSTATARPVLSPLGGDAQQFQPLSQDCTNHTMLFADKIRHSVSGFLWSWALSTREQET